MVTRVRGPRTLLSYEPPLNHQLNHHNYYHHRRHLECRRTIHDVVVVIFAILKA